MCQTRGGLFRTSSCRPSGNVSESADAQLDFERLRDFFFKTFVVYYRARRVANSRSKAFLGIGAFNMVRNSVFRELNGMERIRMEVVDDLMLGKLIKHSGFNQHVLVAREDISVPWYASIREMVVGLDKNTYAGVNYNPIILLTMLTAMTAAFLWPSAVFLFPGTLRLLFP